MRAATFLLTCVIFFSCSACSWGTTAAVVGYRAMTGAFSRSPEVQAGQRRSIGDNRAAWRRVVTDMSGEPINPGRSEWPVRVHWDIPFETGPGVEALAGLGSLECAFQGPAKGVWGLTDKVGRVTGEAWRVTTGVPGPSGIGVLDAEALGRRLDVQADYRVTWVLIVPEPGAHFLQASWTATTSDDLGAAPCIDAWVALPLSLAMSLTANRVSPDASVPAPSTLSPFESWQAQTGPSRGDRRIQAPIGDGLQTQLPGMLGFAAHDLVLLHRLAQRVAQGGALSEDPDTVRRVRLQLLTQVRGLQGPEARAVCQAERANGLSLGSYRLWNDQPTVPAEFLPECG